MTGGQPASSAPRRENAPVIHVGVTGHRLPPKLPSESVDVVRATVGHVLDQIVAAVPGPSPLRLIVVSSLAEGADQIVAEEGLARGGALDVHLPFTPEEYRNDFADDEISARFDALLKQARARNVLDCPREEESRAYEAAGLAMLAESDILIAVWDEGKAAGRGGTAHIVHRAIAKQVPVILINPNVPDRAVLVWSGFDTMPAARFEEIEQREVSPHITTVMASVLRHSPPRE